MVANASDSVNATNLTHCEALAASYDRGNPSTQVAGGILLATTSCFLSSIGLLIMKRSADVEAGKPLRKRWRWWLGFAINTSSELFLTTMAFTMAPLSLITPIGGLAIIFSALIARFGCIPGLRESLSRVEWAAILLALTGVSVLGPLGPSPEYEMTYDAMQEAFRTRVPFAAWTCFAWTYIFSWFFINLCPGLQRFRTPATNSKKTVLLSAFGAACAGSYSMLFSKIVMTALVQRMIANGDMSVAGYWITWVSLIGLIAAAPTQLYFLNMAFAAGKGECARTMEPALRAFALGAAWLPTRGSHLRARTRSHAHTLTRSHAHPCAHRSACFVLNVPPRSYDHKSSVRVPMQPPSLSRCTL
jgi:hypothetical protein